MACICERCGERPAVDKSRKARGVGGVVRLAKYCGKCFEDRFNWIKREQRHIGRKKVKCGRTSWDMY